MIKLFKWSPWIVYVSMLSFFSFQPIDLTYATFYVIHKSLEIISFIDAINMLIDCYQRIIIIAQHRFPTIIERDFATNNTLYYLQTLIVRFKISIYIKYKYNSLLVIETRFCDFIIL